MKDMLHKLTRVSLDLKARSVAYTAIQATWGFPQTALGAIVFLANAKRPHFRYHGAIVTTWESRKALSSGLFVFMHGSHDSHVALESIERRLLVHEYGHTVQSLVLGPLYLPVIGLPSLVWLNVPALSQRRRRLGVSYYGFYTERLANWLGERVLNEPSVGLALID